MEEDLMRYVSILAYIATLEKVLNGRYITVTCGEKGRLRINLKATYLNEDFAVEDFAKGIAQEINQALDGLIEKE